MSSYYYLLLIYSGDYFINSVSNYGRKQKGDHGKILYKLLLVFVILRHGGAKRDLGHTVEIAKEQSTHPSIIRKQCFGEWFLRSVPN